MPKKAVKSKQKVYRVEFTVHGFVIIPAKNEDKARDKAMKINLDDFLDDIEITGVTEIDG